MSNPTTSANLNAFVENKLTRKAANTNELMKMLFIGDAFHEDYTPHPQFEIKTGSLNHD